ncbi:uncharacterized protein SPAPADRAFT_47944 [Spathaspora passalidarum NRRL Y-27907]|uniref:Uncharacterized protein n=1 Tax=Spathaspora passalidarum (strain NRRL Y-27907 / 11-Y1) TaxID=619300 RepID=G3AF84_SPAPN|nr:uncharacterized protein SPAPADRAFT_47944 [Spathaspora passalidarum NRRL Y-27907]EGW34873.1 hypothetical protein SPAPADRAFT_47944 [Spathaspora passalidarum NRRL Y-27907]
MNAPEDPLGEFDISLIESYCPILPPPADFKDSSLFVLPELDLNYDLDSLLAPTWTNCETIAPSALSSPSHSRCHSKQLSLASPLLESKILPGIPPLIEQDDSPLSSPPTSNCPSTIKKSASRRKSRSRNNSIGCDIFSYNYCTTNNTKFKVSKSANTSPILKPPLKPSVTIASIDTLGRFQKSTSSNFLSGSKSSPPAPIAPPPPLPPPTTKKRSKSVGNPFYKPIMHVVSPSQQQQRQKRTESFDSTSLVLDNNSFIETTTIDQKLNEEVFVVESLFGNYNRFANDVSDNKENYFDPLSESFSV